MSEKIQFMSYATMQYDTLYHVLYVMPYYTISYCVLLSYDVRKQTSVERSNIVVMHMQN